MCVRNAAAWEDRAVVGEVAVARAVPGTAAVLIRIAKRGHDPGDVVDVDVAVFAVLLLRLLLLDEVEAAEAMSAVAGDKP